MPGEIVAVAGASEQLFKFMNLIGDYFIDPNKWAAASREEKLDVIREGINVAITNGQWAMVDKWMAAYRVLHEQTGP